MESLVGVLERTEFFRGLQPQYLATLAACATPVHHEPGDHLCRGGESVHAFWLIQSGQIALGFFLPGRYDVTVATLSEGDVAGFSWLFVPNESRFDIVAVTAVTALRFDGVALRARLEADPVFGYQLLQRFTRVIADRVDKMSLQLLDVYGHHPIEHQ